ncbi:molecular chaperone [Escherichia coli]|nr:molecular chaperone [Escherichia coli]QPE78640.1 molecular chaperone [Escherichia coli O157:H16]EFL5891058.1 molecular chaperone [Escherichia coli]EFN9915415.1 molecular chaperone [Escherichia coli]EIW7406355.1 molecular chaperone [Escherichia coli]
MLSLGDKMTVKILRLIGFFFLFFSMSSSAQNNGVNLNKTRVIFDSSKKSASVKVNNTTSDKKWLVRAWVTNYADNIKTDKFIITPPLYYIQPNESIQLRVENVINSLPADRESIFSINVLTIPEKEKSSDDDSGILQFAVNHRIKLIYRPNKLNDKDEISLAHANIDITKTDRGIIIKNASPYYITLDNVRVDNRDVKSISDFMVEPYGELLIPETKVSILSYKIINDYGARTPVFEVHLKKHPLSG